MIRASQCQCSNALTVSIMLVLENEEASKPLGNDLKFVSVIEMTHLYGARESFHPLRTKNTIKLPTQSALSQICMGKWPVPSGAIYFRHVVVVRFVPGFFLMAACLQTPQ